MKRFFVLLGFASVVAVVAACGDDEEGNKVGNGVNDVKQACQIRAAWSRSGENCSICEAAVVSPQCDCEALKDFTAACMDQAEARKTACGDTLPFDTCVNTCQKPDCDCVERCYANQEACKRASDARDGCIAAACESFCK
jgi:hypothetical protein